MGAPALLTNTSPMVLAMQFNIIFFNIKTFILMNRSVTTVCCAPFPYMKQAVFKLFNYAKLSKFLVE